MRINYYEFPGGIDAHTRYTNGAMNIDGECTQGYETCHNCPLNHGGGWRECEHYKCIEAEESIGGITITAVVLK